MRTALIITLLAIVLAQDKINYLSNSDQTASIEVIIEKFAVQQPELYRKVFLNFINERIVFWRAELTTEEKIREQLLFLVSEPTSPLETNLREFMQTKLFSKLGTYR